MVDTVNQWLSKYEQSHLVQHPLIVYVTWQCPTLFSYCFLSIFWPASRWLSFNHPQGWLRICQHLKSLTLPELKGCLLRNMCINIVWYYILTGVGYLPSFHISSVGCHITSFPGGREDVMCRGSWECTARVKLDEGWWEGIVGAEFAEDWEDTAGAELAKGWWEGAMRAQLDEGWWEGAMGVELAKGWWEGPMGAELDKGWWEGAMGAELSEGWWEGAIGAELD